MEVTFSFQQTHRTQARTYGKGRQVRQLMSLGVGLEVVSVSYEVKDEKKNMSMCKKSEKGKEIWG